MESDCSLMTILCKVHSEPGRNLSKEDQLKGEGLEPTAFVSLLWVDFHTFSGELISVELQTAFSKLTLVYI